MDLSAVGLPGLEALAVALEAGRLPRALTVGSLRAAAPLDRGGAEAVLAVAQATGLTGAPLAAVLRVVAVERRRAQALSDAAELVWTGPEVLGSETRETAVVIRELFRRAARRVIVSSYALDSGERAAGLFEELAARHDRGEIAVTLFVNIGRAWRDGALEDTPDTEILRRFATRFRAELWPGERLPEVYYDPRALDPTPGPRACLHAKVVVADDRYALVTSANFTEAAHERNLEAGVLMDNPAFARRVRRQLDMLVEAQVLRAVSLKGPAADSGLKPDR